MATEGGRLGVLTGVVVADDEGRDVETVDWLTADTTERIRRSRRWPEHPHAAARRLRRGDHPIATAVLGRVQRPAPSRRPVLLTYERV